jgi:GT2 family glycosyltransferase
MLFPYLLAVVAAAAPRGKGLRPGWPGSHNQDPTDRGARMGPILVAICTYDRYPLLARTLAAAAAQQAGGLAWRALVVDNSPDRARARAEQARHAGAPWLDYRLEARPGIANARNVALRVAQERGAGILAFLDDDTVPRPDWLARLVAGFDAPDIAAVAGKVELEWPRPRPPWLHDLALPYLSLVDWGPARRDLAAAEWVACANLAFRVAPLLAAGGFDPGLGRLGGGGTLVSNEESEALLRLRRAGGRVAYVPDAVVSHLVHPDRLTQTWFRRRAAWQAVSDYLADPPAACRRAGGAWREIRHYTRSLPWWRRGLASLERDLADPRLFMKQLHAIYLLTLKQLAGLPREGGGDQDA